MIRRFLVFLKRRYCAHLFRASDMQPRDENGIVRWECCRCKRVFSATYGLAILENGMCDGRWDLPNKYYDGSKK